MYTALKTPKYHAVMGRLNSLKDGVTKPAGVMV